MFSTTFNLKIVLYDVELGLGIDDSEAKTIILLD